MSTISIAPHRVAAPRATARPAATPARRSGSVRLTRRGRAVVFLLASVAVAAVAIWLAAGSAATRDAGDAGAVTVVTVAPGETLWDIASDVAASTDDDVRGAMDRIQDLNTLDGSVVYAGQELRVPTATD
ncbi:LysM peptidoglycan-binding domain-containing protein [Nocardioides sp. W3-2-3]|uniref:LysM peptidoglycan-binding domain-containing protein n=1 Tax=Nocardioides convexus TaxID=2712224 RepID=UPI0024187CB9|nr:LysM peptidoglycan-binding domain-containing protein [Nocardioides convexus]NHA00522.1 LysM peptidoglycan-binding domain-containing protein [Nocardioides convexus]